jgi:hypothetical protein
MKVWYFIQTHKNPEQIYRLVRTIKQSSQNARILIAHDFTKFPLDISPLQDLSEIHLIKVTKPVVRADFSLLRPFLMAIDWLLQYEPDFDWLVYLSGQDYPVKPTAEIENFLAHTEYDGFIRHWQVLSADSPWGKGRGWKRYFCRFYRFPEWSRPLLKLAVDATQIRKKIKIGKIRALIPDLQPFFTYGAWVGVPVKTTPFHQDFVCYGGFLWNTLSGNCVKYFKEFTDSNPEIIHYYKGTASPEESLIQTILVNSQKFNLCNDDKRYFDIHNQPGGHPRTLGVQDYSTLTSGDFHFARKFDPEKDSEILDLLDRKGLQKIQFTQ